MVNGICKGGKKMPLRLESTHNERPEAKIAAGEPAIRILADARLAPVLGK